MRHLMTEYDVDGIPEAEGISEPEVSPEPQEEPEVIPEPEETGFAEPEPNWRAAYDEWGVAWPLHVYIFSTSFLILAVLVFVSLCYFFKDRRLIKRGTLTFSLLCLLMLFTCLRSFTMYVDPYGTRRNIPAEYSSFLSEIALPGLTASYSVLLLVLLDTTKMTLGPPRFQKLSTILIFTAVHFSVVIVSDLVYFVCQSCTPMLVVCKVLFIMYGTTLGVGYLWSSIIIRKNCTAGRAQGQEERKIRRLQRMSVAASVTSFAISATYIYSAASEFGLYGHVTYVDAWDWWILKTVIRLEEVISCSLVLVIAFRNPFGENCFIFKRWRLIGKKKTAPLSDTNRTVMSSGTPSVFMTR